MRGVLVALALSIAMAAGCRSDRADEILETAKFEELQQNRTHARDLYEEILREHPDSAAASEARSRLEALSKP